MSVLDFTGLVASPTDASAGLVAETTALPAELTTDVLVSGKGDDGTVDSVVGAGLSESDAGWLGLGRLVRNAFSARSVPVERGSVERFLVRVAMESSCGA